MKTPRVLFPQPPRIKTLAALLCLALGLGLAQAQTFPGKIGVEAGERQPAFIDIGKVHRAFQLLDNSGPTPYDANGWPMSDGFSVLFDLRPTFAWAPPIDDPEELQPDVDGVYKLIFTGQADLAFRGTTGGAHLSITNKVYDSGTNTTTADVTLAEDNGNWASAPALITIEFSNTRRTAASALNTGITHLRFIQPGYTEAQASSQIFTTEFLDAHLPFSFIRVMNWLETNYNAWHGGPGNEEIDWVDRQLPTDATQRFGQAFRHGAQGYAWEYIIALSNLTNTDVWINIPVSATGTSPTDTTSYVYKLAQGFRYGFQANGQPYTSPQTSPVWPPLNSNLKIYIEHSNEVWNNKFTQYAFNKNRAMAEVNAGGSNLNIPQTADQEVWTRRRHARRTYECGKIFEAVFGAGSLNTKIRPVFCHRANVSSQFTATLDWMQSTFGPPSAYFYAIAGANYFNDDAARTEGTPVEDVLTAMLDNSNSRASWVQSSKAVADNYGLPFFGYEGGPDSGGSSTDNIGNRILANRDPAMTAIVEHHYRNNWFGNGGDLVSYFSIFGAYSRHGCWGLSEDVKDIDTPKWQAIYNLIGAGLPPVENPAFSPPAGTYANAQSVAISTTTGGASIRYTTNGTNPSETVGTLYTGPVNVAATMTLKAIAYKSGMANSAVVSAGYTIGGTVAPPTFDPPAGSYGSAQSVALATITSGASIRYTTDGSNPSPTSGIVYTTPISVTATTTIKAIAYLSGMTSSSIVSATYTLGSPPAAPTNLVATAGDQQVSLTWDAVSGATSYTVEYTTGGNFHVAGTPATNSFTHADLTNGVQYSYFVTASNAFGESEPSNDASATPTAPPPGPVLAGFDFATFTGPEATATASTQGIGVTVSTLTRGSGATGGNTNNNQLGGFNTSGSTSFAKPTLAEAVSASHYFQFAITPTSGPLNIAQIFYSAYAQNNGAGPGNFSIDVQYSLDGFATAGVSLGGNSGVTPRTVGGMLGNPFTLDTSAVAALQGVTGTVTFRLYGYKGAAWTSKGIGFDAGEDIRVIGAPSTTVTLTSVAAHDGWAMESGETTNAGGSKSNTGATTSALRAGDNYENKQYKAVVSFDTSSIPDGATIVSATLKLRRGMLPSGATNPFTTHGTCHADIKGGTGLGGSTSLANGDFEATADAAQVATMSNAANNGDWSTGSLNASGLSFVNQTGHTQLRVYFSTDDNNDSGNDYIGWHSGDDATAANRPVLEVTYQ